MRLSPKDLQAFLDATPPQSAMAGWSDRKRRYVERGFEDPDADHAVRTRDLYLSKMEDAPAAGPWILGNTFSLADAALTPYVNRLDMLSMSAMWERSRPNVTAWFARIKDRASFKPALLDWIPDQLATDLRTFGAQSWPNVERVLAA